MITGFEEITYELTKYEKEMLLPKIIEYLENSVGKENAISNNEILARLMVEGYKAHSSRIRKIIHEIRVNNVIKGVLATQKGYYIATNSDEIESYIISLNERRNSIGDVRNSLINYHEELKMLEQIAV